MAHAGGRPVEWTPERIQDVIDIEDKYLKKIFNKEDFKNEKELTEFIIKNIEDFTKDVLKDKLIKFEKNQSFNKNHYFGISQNGRIDLIIRGKLKTYAIEIKNPKQIFHELSRSLSQLLTYIVLSEEQKKKINKFYILTSKYDNILIKVIKRFKLPINVIVLNKEYVAVWLYNRNLDKKYYNGTVGVEK